MSDIFASAWLAVRRHRLRSVLAIAGVAIGVCALTSIMSVEKSWRNAVIDFFAPMDLETVRVTIPAGESNWREQGFSKAPIEIVDARLIEAECSEVQSATFMTCAVVRVETADSALNVAIRAVESDFMRTLPDEIREGRVFTEEESASRAAVCMLSLEAWVWLFGDRPAVGEDIRIAGERFKVIGIIAGNKHANIGSRAAYIPLTWRRRLKSWRGGSATPEVFARAQDPKAAVTQIEKLMREQVGGDGSRPFTRSLWRKREVALNSRTRATLYSGLAGLCALLAAGIGIAAMLFVSVAERSREIGICRALGAVRGHIYGEYVLTAAIIAALGGFLGALVGIPAAAAGAFASRWQPVFDPVGGATLMYESTGLPEFSEIALSVSWEAIAIAFALALITGVLAALAPASEAAGIDPAKAIAQRAGTRGTLRKALTCIQVAFGVLVLIVLTSYFTVMQSEEKAEARTMLGQDRVSALADPIAALRKPVSRQYLHGCRDALAQVVATPEKWASLQKQTPLLSELAPVVPLYLTAERGGRTADAARVIFTTAEAFSYDPQLKGESMQRAVGAFRRNEAAAVISPGLREKLFGDRDPVGETISIAGQKLIVAAVREDPIGYSSSGAAWAPLVFYEPLKHRAIRGGNILDIFMEVRVDGRPLDELRYAESAAQLRDALLPMMPEKYRVGIKMSEYIPETTKQFIFQHKAAAARGAVGALAVLLVALIGLANMLLVSVHDAVHEIGLRRASGAQRSDIVQHFLSEGVLLSALGVVCGVLAGILVCWLTRSRAGLPIFVSMFWVAAGAVATITAGALISLFPALVASRIQPVEALHYE
ncbi:MAG: FtsX-like permease family protein [Armatimonadetes bacterium]|nr:FtsX-like permease family protein [Armatimonadota bacterium]NIO75942.1 FtsX-like permease family protein [Armatimonadota bacterium]NIO98754.1 FtsX-like permease family protein [Armatimonadota bacterium]